MKYNWFILLFSFLFLGGVYSQSWKFNKDKDPFEGDYSSAYIVGAGSKEPYTSPLFVINYFDKEESVNIYFSDVGYSGCDNKTVKIAFDLSDTILTFETTSDKNNEIWFLVQKQGFESLIKSVKSCRKMYVRIESDCNFNSLEFTLKGSSSAVEKVLPTNYFEEQSKKFNELIAEAINYKTEGKLDESNYFFNKASKLNSYKADSIRLTLDLEQQKRKFDEFIEKAIDFEKKGWSEESNYYFKEASKLNKRKTDSIKSALKNKTISHDVETSCYEKLINAFDKRGSDSISNLEREDVIISVRNKSKPECYAGVADIFGQKVQKLWIIDVESNKKLIYDVKDSEEKIIISNGYSSDFYLKENEVVNVFLINKLKEKRK
jgi:hypothetical protein